MIAHGGQLHSLGSSLFKACSLLLLALASSATSAAPIACDAPVGFVEKSVCGDKEVRSLDELVHRLFEDALRSSNGDTSISEQQRKWLVEQRDKCSDSNCLKDVYYARLDALDAFARQRLDKAAAATLSVFVGTWSRSNPSGFEPSQLVIDGEDPREFQFKLFAENGVRSGAFVGKAEKSSSLVAKYDGDISCQLEFKLRGNSALTLVESGCNDIGGVGVTFGGEYQRGDTVPAVGDRNFLAPPVTNEAFRNLVGDTYSLFLATAHLVSDVVIRDEWRGSAKSFVVRGLSSVRESIVMTGTNGELWAAVIEPVDGENLTPKVLYFTNQPTWINQMPITFNEWMKGFQSYPVVFKSVPLK